MRDLRDIRKKEIAELVAHVDRLHELRASTPVNLEELEKDLVNLYHHRLELIP